MFQNEIEDWNRTVWRVLLKFILLHIHCVAPKNTKKFKIADKFIWIILRKTTLLDNNHALLSVKKLNQRYLFNRDYDVQKTAFKALIKRLSPTAWTMPIRTFTYNYTNIFTIIHIQNTRKNLWSRWPLHLVFFLLTDYNPNRKGRPKKLTNLSCKWITNKCAKIMVNHFQECNELFSALK